MSILGNLLFCKDREKIFYAEARAINNVKSAPPDFRGENQPKEIYKKKKSGNLGTFKIRKFLYSITIF